MRKRKIFNNLKFTMVELLLVIAIITILTAMLLPAMNKVRSRVMTANCSSNLKQLGISFYSYLNDNGDYFPIWASGSGVTENWAYNLHRDQYIANNKIFYCRAFEAFCQGDYSTLAKRNAWKEPTAAWIYLYVNYGYNYVYLGCNYWQGLDSLKLTPTPKLSMLKKNVVMLADSIDEHNGFIGTLRLAPYAPGAVGTALMHDRHNSAANVLWTDGHVTLEKRSRERLQSMPSLSYMKWTP